MVSAGCPEVTPYHSGRVAEMGLKMLSVVRHFKKVEIRLGIHTGGMSFSSPFRTSFLRSLISQLLLNFV